MKISTIIGAGIVAYIAYLIWTKRANSIVASDSSKIPHSQKGLENLNVTRRVSR